MLGINGIWYYWYIIYILLVYYRYKYMIGILLVYYLYYIIYTNHNVLLLFSVGVWCQIKGVGVPVSFSSLRQSVLASVAFGSLTGAQTWFCKGFFVVKSAIESNLTLC